MRGYNAGYFVGGALVALGVALGIRTHQIDTDPEYRAYVRQCLDSGKKMDACLWLWDHRK